MSDEPQDQQGDYEHEHDDKGVHAHAADEAPMRRVEMTVNSVASTVDMQPGSHFALAAIPSLFEITERISDQGESWVVYEMHDVGGVARRIFPHHIAAIHLNRLAEILGKKVVDAGGIEIATNLNGIDPRGLAG